MTLLSPAVAEPTADFGQWLAAPSTAAERAAPPLPPKQPAPTLNYIDKRNEGLGESADGHCAAALGCNLSAAPAPLSPHIDARQSRPDRR